MWTREGAREFTSSLPTFLRGSKALANVRFGAVSGLKSDIASRPKSAMNRHGLHDFLDADCSALDDTANRGWPSAIDLDLDLATFHHRRQRKRARLKTTTTTTNPPAATPPSIYDITISRALKAFTTPRTMVGTSFHIQP